MKRSNSILLINVLLIASLNLAFSQAENVNIELSKPDEPGSLSISVIDSPITIQGYDGKDVKISIVDNRRNSEKNRSQYIGLFFTFIEDDNEVLIRHQRKRTKGIDLVVQVPRNFSLDLHTVYGKLVKVDGINGNIEVDANTGDIQVTNSSGSVILYTANGDIDVTLNELSSEYPSAISNVYGDIEFKMPENTPTTVNIDSYSMELTSEFEMTLDASVSSRNEKVRNSIKERLKDDPDRWKVMRRVDDFLENNGAYFTLNGGGALVRLKNHRGKIKIGKTN